MNAKSRSTHLRAPELRAPSLAELAGDLLTAECSWNYVRQ